MSEIEAEFEAFWAEYPRKQAKLDALKAYRQIKTRYNVTVERLVAAVSAYRRRLEADGTEACYIKMPAGWLRSGRWMDDEQETIVPKKNECLMRKVRDLDELKASLIAQHGSIPPNLALELNRARSLADVSDFLRNRLVPNIPANVTPLRKVSA